MGNCQIVYRTFEWFSRHMDYFISKYLPVIHDGNLHTWKDLPGRRLLPTLVSCKRITLDQLGLSLLCHASGKSLRLIILGALRPNTPATWIIPRRFSGAHAQIVQALRCLFIASFKRNAVSSVPAVTFAAEVNERYRFFGDAGNVMRHGQIDSHLLSQARRALTRGNRGKD